MTPTSQPLAAGSFRTVLATRAAAVLALLIAGWPVLRWYALRLGDGSDEPHGLAALAAALFFAPWSAWRESLSPRRHATLAALLLVYCAAFPFAPPLARALLFVVLLGVAAAPRGFALAWATLLALSLPLVATLQFYLGYPLRALTATLAAPLLAFGGLRVEASGTTLAWAGERVVVDTPCSGLRMLWTGLVLAAVLACRLRLHARASFKLFRQAALAVFVANTLRAAFIFCLETDLWPNPSWAHETVGLALFAAVALGIVALAERRITAAATA
jgi:exosortase/archaeosortase family protein